MNPTGTTYLMANTGYVWMDGDVYLIPQTDTVEGAWPGASFGGIGDSNQPHQLILNKLQEIHAKQVTDEANLAALETINFTSSVNLNTDGVFTPGGLNGWLKFGVSDINLGQIQPIMQWGTMSLGAYGNPAPPAPIGSQPPMPAVFSFNFPIAFSNAIWALWPYLETDAVTQVFSSLSIMAKAVTPLQKQGNQLALLLINSATTQGQLIASAQVPHETGITGIGWVALGY
jgi:hypothetical protein